jgi:hypothetical protein
MRGPTSFTVGAGAASPGLTCHATGIGQPKHCHDHPMMGVMYLVSPCARCPCNNTELAYYDCCWKDSATPAYLQDATGHVGSDWIGPQKYARRTGGQ